MTDVESLMHVVSLRMLPALERRITRDRTTVRLPRSRWMRRELLRTYRLQGQLEAAGDDLAELMADPELKRAIARFGPTASTLVDLSRSMLLAELVLTRDLIERARDERMENVARVVIIILSVLAIAAVTIYILR